MREVPLNTLAMKLATTVIVKMIDSQRWVCRIQLLQSQCDLFEDE